MILDEISTLKVNSPANTSRAEELFAHAIFNLANLINT